MKLSVKPLLLTVFAFSFTISYAQVLRLEPTKPIVCYQSHLTTKDYIPHKHHPSANNARTKSTSFIVEYYDFPADAQDAFQYAVDIWASEITSNVPIRIVAQWHALSPGVLGQAQWGNAFANFEGAQYLNTYYPVALAEKMAGKDLNDPFEADINAEFSSAIAWYFGTDGNVPAGKMDFVTVVLHEIAHGLGFTDTYNVNGTTGSVGLNGPTPFVYDVFLENASGQNIFQSFASPSTTMKSQLTSNAVRFNSHLSKQANNNDRVRLYSPSTFNGGSSIAHLDESTFSGAFNQNKLMTPQIDFQEAVHDPGDIARGILNDLGWKTVNFDHNRLKDSERRDNQGYPVTVKITSDNGYDENNVVLHYTSNGTTYGTLNMAGTGNTNEFAASLPGTLIEKDYGYYVTTSDASGREFTYPGKIQASNKAVVQDLVVFHIGTDTDEPVISHAPVDAVANDATTIDIEAIVTDNVGVKDVWLEYQMPGEIVQQVTMSNTASNEDVYRTSITLNSISAGQFVRYRIVATDEANNTNASTLPRDGYYNTLMIGILNVVDHYTNDFNQESSDLIGNTLRVELQDGFNDGAIHSQHPYADGSGVNDESNYIVQLAKKIKIDASNPYIHFNEIVLVEPGDNGSVFGDDSFYDYVVVEGSNNNGITWVPFEDGYDARRNTEWLNEYNNNINDGSNSDAVGTPSMFKPRTIKMTKTSAFQAGDEVMIRFRLFADQAAHGWGWAIDNLAIQTLVTSEENEVGNGFEFYPNPVKDKLTIEIQSNIAVSNIDFFTLQGNKLNSFAVSTGTHKLNLDAFPAGCYIMKIETPSGTITRKIFKVN